MQQRAPGRGPERRPLPARRLCRARAGAARRRSARHRAVAGPSRRHRTRREPGRVEAAEGRTAGTRPGDRRPQRRELGGLDPDRLGVCLDACHLAVQFEQPAAALRRLADAGLPVVKLQASCAVEAHDPADPAARAALGRLAEPRFLHQTRTTRADTVLGADDLPDALDGGLPDDTGPWRVHFHAPLHTLPEPPLRTTADQLGHVLAGLLGGACADCHHIEVETYTWSVLPEPPADLAGGIAAELDRARDRLTELGLKEIPS